MHRQFRLPSGAEDGFSLVEILVALAVLTIIGAALVFSFNFNKSKGQVLYSLMDSVGNAAIRFSVDTSCYPYTTDMLFSQTDGTTNTNTSCGTAVGNLWNGPYMKTLPVNASKDILVPQVAPNVTLTITDIGPVLPTGNAHQYAVVASNVPTEIANQAERACGGANSNCRVGTGSPLTTFEYVFAQSN